MPLDYIEFSKKIKQKYPQYKDVDDMVLAKKMVEKYPEYRSQVEFQELKKKNSTGSYSQLLEKSTTSATVKTTTQKPSVSSGGKKVEVFTNLPGKEANEYRVINNKWQRLIPNSNKWEEIKSDGAISYLNDYYKKNIPAPTKEPKKEEKPILGNMMTSFLVEGIAERDPEYKESEQYINDLK
jgi:hypothetical protein